MLESTAELTAQYAQEHLDDALWSQLIPLLREHFAEAGECPDLPLDPNRAAYAAVDRVGALRIYTARLGSELIGYLAMIIGPSLHHAERRHATTDVLFVRRSERHTLAGLGLLLHARKALAEEGVAWLTVGCRVGEGLDFGNMLSRLGFAPTHTTWLARLDTTED